MKRTKQCENLNAVNKKKSYGIVHWYLGVVWWLSKRCSQSGSPYKWCARRVSLSLYLGNLNHCFSSASMESTRSKWLNGITHKCKNNVILLKCIHIYNIRAHFVRCTRSQRVYTVHCQRSKMKRNEKTNRLFLRVCKSHIVDSVPYSIPLSISFTQAHLRCAYVTLCRCLCATPSKTTKTFKDNGVNTLFVYTPNIIECM